MERRAHPTVRPHALALGVVVTSSLGATPRRGLCPPLPESAGAELARALLTDTLSSLMTFPVRFRFAFAATEHGGAEGLGAHVSEAWRCEDLLGATPFERHRLALDLLLSTGAEAALLLRADVAGWPLGELFDALLWLIPKKRFVVGTAQDGRACALGAAERLDDLVSLAVTGDRAALEARAAADGVALSTLAGAYAVESEEDLRRLGRDAAASAHLQACRRLFLQPDFLPYGDEKTA